jgi:hypothetical protein
MDKFGVSAVSEFYETAGRCGRIQRQVYDKSDGFARRFGRDAGRAQPQNLSKFFSPASALAVYGNQAGKVNLKRDLREIQQKSKIRSAIIYRLKIFL